jgi:hypothetical protein
MKTIEQVAGNNRPGWKDDAASALIRAARKVDTGTIEEFRQVVKVDPPRDERAWGAVVQLLEREGWIKKTSRFRSAKSSHRSPKRVWVYCR